MALLRCTSTTKSWKMALLWTQANKKKRTTASWRHKRDRQCIELDSTGKRGYVQVFTVVHECMQEKKDIQAHNTQGTPKFTWGPFFSTQSIDERVPSGNNEGSRDGAKLLRVCACVPPACSSKSGLHPRTCAASHHALICAATHHHVSQQRVAPNR